MVEVCPISFLMASGEIRSRATDKEVHGEAELSRFQEPWLRQIEQIDSSGYRPDILRASAFEAPVRFLKSMDRAASVKTSLGARYLFPSPEGYLDGVLLIE